MRGADDRLDASVLAIDARREIDKIATRLVEIVGRTLRRRGVVVALSGGVDSSVCVALAVRAFGPERVHVLLLPEKESSPESLDLGRAVCETVGARFSVQDLTGALEALGAYAQRDAAIREVFPEYDAGWKNKIVIAGGLAGGLNHFRLVVSDPCGATREARLRLDPYLRIVAAQNYKQRLRKTVEFFHADRLNYAVVGTPNRLEYDQGFFVRNGDGSADVKPIAHLYKSQVYALARELGLPRAVCEGRPTTDTYTLAQGQDEFFFGLPYEKMDLALWAKNHGVPAERLAAALDLPPEAGRHVYTDIDRKRAVARRLHARAVLVEPVPEPEVG